MTKLESLLMNARSTLRQAVCPQCGRNGCVDTNLHCDWCVLRFDLNTEFLNFQSEPERPRVSALETERGHVPASIMWGDDEPPAGPSDKQVAEAMTARCDVLSQRLDQCALALVDLSNLDARLSAKGLTPERELLAKAASLIAGQRLGRSSQNR